MLEEVELEKLQAWATVENVWMEQMAFVDNLFVITTATEAKRRRRERRLDSSTGFGSHIHTRFTFHSRAS